MSACMAAPDNLLSHPMVASRQNLHLVQNAKQRGAPALHTCILTASASSATSYCDCVLLPVRRSANESNWKTCKIQKLSVTARPWKDASDRSDVGT